MLENEDVIIEGLKIWGSPYTPSFGYGWSFNKDRGKIHEIWDTIPDDTDIIATHGPVKGILDLSYNRNNELEYCGCANLAKRVREIKPLIFCHGHLHSSRDGSYTNHGILYRDGTYYSNASAVADGGYGKIVYHGSLFEINTITKEINILTK